MSSNNTPLEIIKMNDKEAEYYASEFTDAQIDTIETAPRAYNSESRGFDGLWPFGPDSTQQ
jgi:hypothetical protein